eukprot:TRINITY_DN3887_c0_g1_i1.p1 TRINITY_DN3887_c0_g1~~TRINITY_DN3887_c0_g1_i1.p1  ORF type:complete len:288 (+),score=25.65 TRINITY_DN3887_c0_g1_i1:216-1079(+)
MNAKPQFRDTDPILSYDSDEPIEELKRLQKCVETFYRGDYDFDVVRNISESLRSIEGSVCRRYERLPKETRKSMDIGDMKETLDAISELRGGIGWLFRFPSLIITVAIASFCIPIADQLEDVIVQHPILGGFPPAISAAAGCIGIQNTAIIIRALGVKLVKTNRMIVFLRYCLISCCLSLGAAIIECIVAWIVISAKKDHDVDDQPWSFDLLISNVPIVIFFAMFVTGTLAGLIGAGVPLLIVKLSEMIHKKMDPAHWVGPIETVVQELCAAMLTFWIAAKFVFPAE